MNRRNVLTLCAAAVLGLVGYGVSSQAASKANCCSQGAACCSAQKACCVEQADCCFPGSPCCEVGAACCWVAK